MSSASKYLLVIAGPTAIGKTDLAIQLAEHYHTVILSADSRQFYRQMNIGTAKPTAEQLSKVKHYFVNNKDMTELYGAGHFATEATELLEELFKQHQLVILTGGSGMYIDALLHGVDEFEEVPLSVRESLNEQFKQHGLEWLQDQLKQKDPEYYRMVDLNNSQRLIRALEVCIHTGNPFSSCLGKTRKVHSFTCIKILLNMERDVLYQRINQRVDDMFDTGLEQEVRSLLPYREMNAMKTVGYRELTEYFDGKCTLEEAKDKIKQHTRNYAKRQLTWFRNQDDYEEFHPTDLEKIKAYIDLIISHG